MKNSIGLRLILISVSGGITALLVGCLAWFGMKELKSNDEALIVNLKAVRNQVEADMMHDALRADVLAAMLDASEGASERQAILGDLADHAGKFRTLLEETRALPLSDEVIAALATVAPALDAYVQSAETESKLAYTDLEAAKLGMANFTSAFKDLETRMESTSDRMESAATAAQEQIRATFETSLQRTGLAILAALLVSAVISTLAIVFARRIGRTLSEVGDVCGAVAQGNLARTVVVKGKDELAQMSTALNAAIAAIRDVIVGVNDTAGQVADVSRILSTTTGEMSDGSQQQASALEETAASLEEITGTVKQNADSARQANSLAVAAHGVAENGGKVVSQAVHSIQEISRSSEKIANIITTIDEIAFQTNLLALNAAVEAARAGEQGRGFAVVASEVRSLAQRSAASAKEIKALIEDSLHKVQAGSNLITQSGKSLEEIITSVKRVTDIIAEISAASQEQAVGVDQVNRAVTQMDQVVQQNAGQATELATTAQSLAEQAEHMLSLVQRFEVGATERSAARSNTASVSDHKRPHAPLPSRTESRTAGSRTASPGKQRQAVLAGPPSDDGFIEF